MMACLLDSDQLLSYPYSPEASTVQRMQILPQKGA